MQFQTLLPIRNGKRTGYVFDTDDGWDPGIQVVSKIVTDDEGDGFLQVKIWTRGGGMYTHFAIDLESHAIIAMASAPYEKKAWRRLVSSLNAKGWKLPLAKMAKQSS